MPSLARCSEFFALLASTTCAVHAADLSHHDKRYLDKTAEGLMAEVEMGRMAQKNVKLPDSPSHKQKREAVKLSKLAGKDFDREYVRYETRDHQEDIKDQAKEMKDTSDADLKKFATAAHSTVMEHYKMVEDLHGKIGK